MEFQHPKNTYLTVETFLRKISKPCRAAGTAPEHSTTTSARNRL